MKTKEQCKRKLTFCDNGRTWLYLNGFITYNENAKIRKRLKKYQLKHQISDDELYEELEKVREQQKSQL